MDKLTKDTIDYFLLSDTMAPLRRIWRQGDLYRIETPSERIPPPRSKKDRVIREFSAQARKRAIEFEATIDWEKTGTCMWAQVGYPDECLPRDGKQLKVDRYLFHRHIEKFYDREIAGVWRVEWEPRKSGKFLGYRLPHWHMLFMNVGETPYGHYNRWWRQVVKPPGKLRCWFKRIYDAEGKALYSAKYCAKVSELTSLGCLPKRNSLGKAHGYFRPELLPRCPREITRQMTESEILAIYDLLALLYPKLVPGSPSRVTVLKSRAGPLLKKMKELGLPLWSEAL